MSVSQRMFGSLWNVIVAHEHRRQDGSRWLGILRRRNARQRPMNKRRNLEGVPRRQPHRRSGLATLPSPLWEPSPIVTPYYCRHGDLLCFVFIVSLLYFFLLIV